MSDLVIQRVVFPTDESLLGLYCGHSRPALRVPLAALDPCGRDETVPAGGEKRDKGRSDNKGRSRRSANAAWRSTSDEGEDLLLLGLRLLRRGVPWCPTSEEVAAPTLLGRRSVRIPAGGRLHTDTYFNSFFECHWRRYTHLGELALRLCLSGAGEVRLWRRTLESGLTLLRTVSFQGDHQEVVISAPSPRVPFRALGALHFEVIAGSGPVVLHAGEWLAREARPAEVQLVAGYCTFNREPYLLPSLRQLGEDEDVADCLRAVVVVDQGTSKLSKHPGFAALPPRTRAQTHVVEQGNFGGAGGFTRAILEALQTPGATHVLLMDDDAALEPESVFRAARFLALAREDLAVGGNMLDLVRPRELFELTAELFPNRLGPGCVIGGFAVDDPENLEPLLEVPTTRYNGWWFMAFPLRLIDRLGLPLPFFLRGDDIELGCRLNAAGVPIAALPGVGVWHEPFYLKSRGWQNYYEIRNVLAVCALHFPQPAGAVVKAFLRLMVRRLLCHEYSEAWLLCEAVEDYLRGPGVLEDPPQPRHQRLLQGLQALTPEKVPGTQHLPVVGPGPKPANRFSRLIQAGMLLLRELRRSPHPQAEPSHAQCEGPTPWWDIARTDVVALYHAYSADRVVLRRSRAHFVRLLARGLWAALRLAWRHHPVVRQWQQAHGRLTGREFWGRYLGLPQADSTTDPGRKAA